MNSDTLIGLRGRGHGHPAGPLIFARQVWEQLFLHEKKIIKALFPGNNVVNVEKSEFKAQYMASPRVVWPLPVLFDRVLWDFLPALF